MALPVSLNAKLHYWDTDLKKVYGLSSESHLYKILYMYIVILLNVLMFIQSLNQNCTLLPTE